MHLDDERVQRWLHRELGARAEAEARTHLATCAECGSRVRGAAREEERVFGLLSRLDHPMPRVHMDAIAAAARGRGRGFGWGRWAAAIFLAMVAAGAAYAAPGSPLPVLVHQLTEWIAPRRKGQVARPLPAAAPVRGIAVPPGDRFTILFASEPLGGVATVSLTADPDVAVRVLRGAATFTADVNRLSIAGSGDSARFEILVPRRARSVQIRIGRRRIFLVETSRVTTQGHPDAEGCYTLPLDSP